MIPRVLNFQGIAGIAASLSLAILLVIQRAEAVHWKKQSGEFEQLYRQEVTSFAATVAGYRAAADQARANDLANSERVAADQRAVNQRTVHDFEARIAAARADAERLRIDAQDSAHPRPGGDASMPGLSAPASEAADAPGQGRLPLADALIATEQAIQLDELIKWVRAQAAIDPNGTTKARR